MKYLFLVTAIFSAVAAPVRANSVVTGNEFYNFCRADKSEASEVFCSGYILGVVEGSRFSIAKMLMIISDGNKTTEQVNSETDFFIGFCHPEDADYIQYKDIFLNYLRNNPETRQESARSLFFESLAEAFPC